MLCLILIKNKGTLYNNSERKPFWHICSQNLSFQHQLDFWATNKSCTTFHEKKLPQKQLKNAIEIINLFFQELNDTVWILTKIE